MITQSQLGSAVEELDIAVNEKKKLAKKHLKEIQDADWKIDKAIAKLDMLVVEFDK